MLIVVTGATGFVGKHVVHALQAAGHQVRCTTRAPEHAHRARPDLDWVELDLARPATIGPALRGCDAAVFLVHGMGPGTTEDYPEHERAGAEAFAAAAGTAGLRRIVYLGGVIPATGASRHLRSRQRTGEILRAGQTETIELRAAMVIGAGSASWMMVHDLARRLPAMLLPRWLRNTSYPIGIDDVVQGVVAALALPVGPSRVYELPGPERVTHREVLVRAAAAMGRRRLMLSVPVLTPRLSSYWIAMVTRTPLAMAQELVEGVRSDLEPTGASLWDTVDHRPGGLDDAIRRALVSEASGASTAGGGPGAPPAARPPSSVRGVTTLVVATLAFTIALALRERVDPWRATAIAALASGGLAWWALGGRAGDLLRATPRGAIVAIVTGGLLAAVTHLAYGAATVASPDLARSVSALYASIDVSTSPLALALLTAIVVLAEELVWRGVAVELIRGRATTRVVGALSVALYVLPQLGGGEPLLIAAAAVLGSLFALQRLITGRLVAPLLTHAIWSVAIFVVWPLE